MIPGIDISAVQGLVDGEKIKAQGTRFVYHRCGVGNDPSDAYFERNLESLRAAGVLVGAYHFIYPLPDVPGHMYRDPISQARTHFLAAHSLGPGSLRTAIDLEWPEPQDWSKWQVSAGSIKQWARSYLAEYTRLSGKKPFVYIYPDFAAHLSLELDFADYPLWLASYQQTPAIVPPWGRTWTVWQNTGGGGRLYDGRPVDTDLIASEDVLTSLVG